MSLAERIARTQAAMLALAVRRREDGMSVAKRMLFEQMARDEAERVVQAKMDHIDGMDAAELKVLLAMLNSHLEALEAEKQYALGRYVDLVPSFED